jgi:DNA-directed RNA polymerase alpha subunit
MHKPAAEWHLRPAEIRDGLKQNERHQEVLRKRKELHDLHESGLSWAEIAEKKGITRAGVSAEGARYRDWLEDPSELKTLSSRSRAALEREGLFTKASVAEESLPFLLRVPGLGRKSAYEIVLWLRGDLKSGEWK